MANKQKKAAKRIVGKMMPAKPRAKVAAKPPAKKNGGGRPVKDASGKQEPHRVWLNPAEKKHLTAAYGNVNAGLRKLVEADMHQGDPGPKIAADAPAPEKLPPDLEKVLDDYDKTVPAPEGAEEPPETVTADHPPAAVPADQPAATEATASDPPSPPQAEAQ